MTTDHGPRPLRDRYTAFVERYEVAWELVMAAITIAWVTISFAEGESDSPSLLAADIVFWAVLAAEFVSRFGAARDRRGYLRGHWIDAIALIPAARALRLLRLFRLLRLVRAFAGIYRALVSFERFAQNRTLVLLFVAWLAVAFICSAALYLAEVGVNPNINEPFDALWWGVTTLTTVGYGDIYPVTAEGRLAAGGLMIIGITLFAGITGTITATLVAQGAPSRGSAADRLRDLVRLRAEGLISDEEFDAKRALLIELL